MISSSNKKFQSARIIDSRRAMVLRYSEFRLYQWCEYLCVVEGSTDRNFYRNSKLFPLRRERCAYFFHSNADSDQDFIGGEAVIRTYKDIKADESLSKELGRTFFIIDRDFEKEPICENVTLSEDEKKCFSLTPYHSMECFFLTDTNLAKLFELLKIPACFKESFIILLRKLRDEVAEHFALVAASVACRKHKWVDLDCKIGTRINNKFDDIFVFSFNDLTYDFRRDLMELEDAKLKPEVEKPKNRLAYRHYQQVKKSIMSNYLFIRGHTLADFLQEFLAQCCNITFEKKLSQAERIIPFIQNMDVCIDLVFGNGKPFRNSDE